jgi:hypothetical protein
MRVELTSRAQVQFDRLDPAEQQVVLGAVRLEATRAARVTGSRRFGHATIRLREPAAVLRVQFSERGALLLSIHRPST